MNLDLLEVFKGIADELAVIKRAEEENLFSIAHGSILPTLSTQAKWEYSKTGNSYHISDGNTVHHFHFPDGENEESAFPIVKKDDIPFYEFGKDSQARGTAQIHRSDPGLLYFTIQDGKSNPTLTFKHISGEHWRAIPKPKKKQGEEIPFDIDAFWNGVNDKLANDSLGDVLVKGLHNLGTGTLDTLGTIGKNPFVSGAVGVGLGGAYDLLRRGAYNTDEENAVETTGQRAARWLVPGLALGVGGAGVNAMFPRMHLHKHF